MEKQNNNRIFTPELLAPAGSRESLCAAIEAGADAVYMGGEHKARAFARNFDREGIRDAIALCRAYGVKAYITLNTLVYERELEGWLEYARYLWECGADAFIVADLGAAAALREYIPEVRLHALGAPEVAHVAKVSGISTREALERLVAAGLDSLPGAGAEILVDRVRKQISPAKPGVEEWLRVMHEAHEMNLPTSATMMYGHIEMPRERIDHLLKIRDLQAQCPVGNWGFIAFIPWIFRSTGTRLEREGVKSEFSPLEYIRMIAVSRLVLNNINNIQASWLTVGKATAQLALHSGANDMGSIMIEENVVSSAGANNSFDAEGIQKAIREAGFEPRLRDQLYRERAYRGVKA